MSETHARVTEVMVTALPLDHPDLRYLTVWVQWRGRVGDEHDRYTVARSRQSAPAEYWHKGEQDWVLECSDDRDDPAHMEATRMTFGEAKALAAEIAPTLTVNGLTVADVIARRAVKP